MKNGCCNRVEQNQVVDILRLVGCQNSIALPQIQEGRRFVYSYNAELKQKVVMLTLLSAITSLLNLVIFRRDTAVI